MDERRGRRFHHVSRLDGRRAAKRRIDGATIATINQGNVQIAATDTAPKNITFDVGAISFNVQPTSTPTSTPTPFSPSPTNRSLRASPSMRPWPAEAPAAAMAAIIICRASTSTGR